MRQWEPGESVVPPGSRFVQLARGRTRYQVAGPESGPQVLLVHGLSYPMEVWSPLVDQLAAQGFRVCRYDLPGRGLSGYDFSPLTPAALCEHLLETLNAVGFQGPTTLVSLSNSDVLLAEVADVAPERVRALLWLAPSGLDPRTMNFTARALGRAPWLSAIFSGPLRRRMARRMEGHRQHLPDDSPDPVRNVYDFAIRSVTESPVFARAVLSQISNAWSAEVLTEKLARLGRKQVPVSLARFRGERDATEAGVRLLLENVPQCRTWELDGTHMGLLEDPPRVNACVFEALTSLASPGSRCSD
ncbi:MAG: alpha/beta hydrolase [Myxococcaceae bacterium]